jgi:hypothetical protein
MIDQLSYLVSRTRRNHGLEHATIHMLSERHKNFSAQGNSNHRGFYLNIFGDISEEDVQAAVEEAHRRMKNGDHRLAVHPNCGTVLLTTAAMGALASQTAFGLEQRRQGRRHMDLNVLVNGLPGAILAGVVSLILSRPVGMAIQEKLTTEGDLGGLEVVRVRQIRPSLVTRFFQLLLVPGKNLQVRSYKVETAG